MKSGQLLLIVCDLLNVSELAGLLPGSVAKVTVFVGMSTGMVVMTSASSLRLSTFSVSRSCSQQHLE